MQRTLIQLDPDKHASSFDAMVAIDSGVDRLLQYSDVTVDDVQNLVYGAIFTRGPADLKNTAFFVGGANVGQGEALLEKVKATFFGPMSVSVLIDSNGANTTASAAVVAARRHVTLQGANGLVLAGTGPVGRRVAQLLALEGANVQVASRSLERASAVCDELQQKCDGTFTPVAPSNDSELAAIVNESSMVFAAGTTGVELLPEAIWKASDTKVVVDLNAVPPLGIAGIKVHDAGVDYDGTFAYGAIGVGGTKMKIHKAAIQALFTDNSLVLDAAEVYRIGVELDSA